MRIPLYHVDAFTNRLFSGNPAAVCPLAEWLPDATMQAIAAENNLAETAFFAPQGEGYLLRWFTPTVEVELCGHATLAAGYVVTRILAPERRSEISMACFVFQMPKWKMPNDKCRIILSSRRSLLTD